MNKKKLILLIIGLACILFMLTVFRKHQSHAAHNDFTYLPNYTFKPPLEKNVIGEQELVEQAVKDAKTVADKSKFNQEESKILIKKAKKLP